MAKVLEAVDAQGNQIVKHGEDPWIYQTHLPEGWNYMPGPAGRQGFALNPEGRTARIGNDGQWAPVDELAGQALPGVAIGAGQSLGNIVGIDTDTSEFNPADVAVGNALGTGAAVAAGGMAGAAALPFALTRLGAAGLGSSVGAPFVGDLLGSGVAAFGTAESGEGGEAAGQEFRDNIEIAAATAAASKALPMSMRVLAAVKNMRPATRDIKEGPGVPSQEAVSRLQGKGFEVTPGQASGDIGTLQLEDANRGRPGQAAPFQDIDQGNQKLYNESAKEAIGIKDPRAVLDPDTLRDQGESIGRDIERIVADIGGVNVDDALLRPIENIANGTDLTDRTSKAINGYVDKLRNAAEDGVVDPKTWRVQRQRMAQLKSSLAKPGGDSFDAQVMDEVIDLWDEMPLRTLERQGDTAGAGVFKQEYSEARERYRNWIALTRGRAVDPNGDVSPRTARANLEQTFRNTFKLNNKQHVTNPETQAFFENTRDLNNPRMIPRVGNSGTATRLQADLIDDRNLASMAQLMQGSAPGIANMFMRGINEIAPRFRLAPEINRFGLGSSAVAGAGVFDLLQNEDR